MAEDDAVIKIGGDVAGILNALESIEKQFAAMGDQMKDFTTRAEPALKKTEGFLDGFVGNLTRGVTALAVERILPAIVKALRRGKNLKDLQELT